MKRRPITIVTEYSSEPMSEAQREEVIRLLAKIIAEAYLKDWRARQLDMTASSDVPTPPGVSSTGQKRSRRNPSKQLHDK